MSDYISKVSVCEILADIYPTDSEKVVAVKKIDKAYEAIQQLSSVQPEIIRCQGCKYARENKGKPWICTHPDNNAWRITKEFYCGRAERWES